MRLARVVAVAVAVPVLALGVAVAPAQAVSCGNTEYADGTFGPTICPDGQPNAKVQAVYAKGTPAIMALGKSTTRKQLQKAICADSKRGVTGEMLYDSVEWQIAANAWSRAIVHPVMHRLVADRYC